MKNETEVRLRKIKPTDSVQHIDELLNELQELQRQNDALRETQTALQESRNYFRNLYEFAPVAYLTLNERGVIGDINLKAALLLGDTATQLLGRNLADFIVAESQDEWKKNRLKNKAYPNSRLKFRRRDGVFFTACLNSQHIKNNKGEQQLRVTISDMSDKRCQDIEIEIEQSRGRLRDDRLLLQSILDNAPISIWMLGVDNKIKFINQTFCDALGINEQQFFGVNHYSTLLPEFIFDNCITSDRESLEREGVQCSEEKMTFVDGREHVLEITKVKRLDHKGLPIGLIGLGADITERKRSEVRLRESEEKFRAIFEGTLDGIILIDDTGRIVDCNPEFMRQTSMALEQIKQLYVWELRPADKVELAKVIFLNLIQTDSRQMAEFKYKKPDGDVIYIESRRTTIHIGGRRYLQCITHDITERKKADVALVESKQRLRDLAAQGAALREAELKHLAREVHDELGQLLTALRMDISLLRIQFGERDTTLMTHIQAMLVLVDKAIQGVRDVSSNLHPAALDMGIVSAITWLINEFKTRTGVSCHFQLIDDLFGMDDAHTLTLFRIVQESLTNIARHAHASHVAIRIQKCDEKVCIEVRDDGCGYDMVKVEEAQSFGLMGMKERALAVGGKVEFSSALGQGTVVFVEVPLLQITPGRRMND
ncbi:MAG: PAS domain S-box protein [Gallionella sp.]